MLDTTDLTQAVETLATETETNAVSPAYLAGILRKVAALLGAAADTSLQTVLQAAIDAEATTRAQGDTAFPHR